MFKKLYTNLAPYILPVLLATTLFFAFQGPEIVEVEVPKITTITETITLPAEVINVPYAVVDTLYNTLHDTTIVYLPGDTVEVQVAHADTTFIFLSSDKDVMIEAKVDVGAKYFGDPLNKFELSSRLADIQLFLPSAMTRTTFYTAGVYFGADKVGVSAGILHKSNYLTLQYDGKGPMLGYSHVFGK